MSGVIQPPYPQNVPVLSGALVTVDATSGVKKTIAFQYNPVELTRVLNAKTKGFDRRNPSPDQFFLGAPTETITFDARLDATDPSTSNSAEGVYPLLSALELLVYPDADQVKAANDKLSEGCLEVSEIKAPRVIFVWGAKRVLPVRVSGVTVKEVLHNADLVPLRATVGLTLEAVTYSDTQPATPDYNLYLSHQSTLESMAEGASAADASKITGVDVDSL